MLSRGVSFDRVEVERVLDSTMLESLCSRTLSLSNVAQ